MIKINLLPPDKKLEKKEVTQTPSRKFLTTLILVVLITLAALVAITSYLTYANEELKKQSNNNKALIGQLQRNLQDIKKYESLNASIEKKSNLIETLRKHQNVPVRILDEISAILPEGVWLTNLSYKDNEVILEGYAFTNLDIVSYIENFKKSPFISEPYLNESKYDEINKIQVYKFKLNFKVKV
ncbi:MAG: PilN domain-containing protein [Thermodesulfovibrionales bacterium]|nr:PilN domain-containing protein [Thermodesulfovibrionales bacterium]